MIFNCALTSRFKIKINYKLYMFLNVNKYNEMKKHNPSLSQKYHRVYKEDGIHVT